MQAPRQHSLSEDLDARRRSDPAFVPCLVADELADLRGGDARHPLRRGARCQPSRFEDHDAPLSAPWGVEERQWHDSRLTGARRRDQHRPATLAQRLIDAGKGIDDGEIGKRETERHRSIV